MAINMPKVRGMIAGAIAAKPKRQGTPVPTNPAKPGGLVTKKPGRIKLY